MMSRLVFLLFCGYIALNLGNAQKLPRVKRQSLKVQINATDDTVCMRYLRPSQNTKLEGFVLGYGSNFFSNQYVPLPSEGNTYVTELDAEPRYLVSVRPARISNNKKSCSGRNKTQKPLQLVVGTLTPTSVFLSWGILVNPQHDWTATNNCASDRFYTVRYREKDKDKKWVFQLCPVTETVVDNLKPNTVYEFGVKDNVEDSIWSKTSNHKIVLSNKKVNGHLQNMYKLVPNAQTQLTLRDNKKLVPVTIIKQVIQNRTQSKTADSSSLPGAILVHLIVPGLNETQQKLPPLLPIDDRPQASRKKLAKNESRVWPAESKTPEVQEISPQTLPATWSPGLKLVSLPSTEATEMEMAFEETQPVSSGSKTSATTEVQPTRSASHDFLHVTSTPQTFTASEIPDTASDTTELKISTPIITTESQLSGTALDLGERKPLSSRSTTSGMPEMPPVSAASQKPGLESTSWTSPETTRPAMATRRPRLKSTTPSSLPTQQTVMASHDFLDVTSTPQTSTSAKISERETVIIQAPFKPASSNNIEEEPATDETPPVSSRPTMFPIPEMPSTKSATQRPGLKFTSHPSIETRGSVMAFDEKQDISLGSETPDIQEMPLTVPASQKPGLESTSWTSPETTRPAMATRRPRLKSTTPSSLPTQQTVMASLDSHHITVRFQTSASAEISKIETVTSSADLEKSVPSLSRTPHVLTTTTAFGGIQPVLSSPVTPSKPEIADAGRATSESILESFTPKTSRAFQWPRVTLAPKESQRVPSKPRTSTKPHIPQVKDVLESITRRTDQLKPTIVPKEIQRVPSKPRTPPISEVPQTKPVLEPITFGTEKPKSTAAPKDTHLVPSKPKTSPSPRVPPTRASPKESRRVPSKPRASPSPDVPHTKPVLATATFTSEQPKTATAPKEPQYAPFRPKAPPIPDAPHRKPEIIPTFHEPETTMIPHIPERTKATLAPTEKQFVHTKPKTTEKPRVPHTKPAVHQTTPLPIITKSSTTTQRSRATMAPKETLLIPSKPKTSVMPEVPQTKPAPRATHLGSINLITVHVVDGSKVTLVPNETYQISPKPKTALATEIPRFHTAPHKTRHTSPRPKPSDKSQTRPALSKTTLAPPRTKAPGLPKWIVPTADEVYTPEDIAREIGMDVKKPLEYSHTWEKPFAVTTSPGPRHPPVPPVKPTQMRRKPLPPNTVTGKPGSPAKPAGPTTPVRTGTSYKTPTAFATPEYYVDATVFSSSPTSETDSSGKPRYQAPHVKYMKKDDDVPCSITSSLEHFPQEEAGSKEEPTRPPQNPPTNLTVVTVEGCPTFVILDWEKPDNDTVTEYEVVSTENGASDGEKEKSITTTNQTHSTVENLKPDTSYEFHVKPRNPLGEGPSSNVVQFSTESADPRVSEPISMGKDAIWTEIPFDSDSYSECKGKQYVKRTWYKKFVGVQLCNSLRYKIYLSDSLTGKFYNIGDQRGHGEDHCQFVDSFLDGRTGQQEDLPVKDGFFRAVRQEPVKFGKIGGETQINYVRWYECGTSIPGKW
ncbi:ABI family, member 3 (NESH) binding protein, transcript variant X10 [Columba livia]|uniref:ABI family, member 3 (NESH) binding protein, transcript variant X10 n=1 Tax=Columba livia TaxID=8932 RepID=A0A2I0MT20_COLLI|nr:ABI family, member 3 (NESH) binding protein, transcript variant X10 [Columba livia]